MPDDTYFGGRAGSARQSRNHTHSNGNGNIGLEEKMNNMKIRDVREICFTQWCFSSHIDSNPGAACTATISSAERRP